MTPTLIAKTGAIAVAALAAAAAACWPANPPMAIGVLAGGAWNLASLWVLMRLLDAWMGKAPSQKRAIGWLIAKFTLLYPSAFLLLRHPASSPMGFGLGFTLVLLIGLAAFFVQAQRSIGVSHGR